MFGHFRSSPLPKVEDDGYTPHGKRPPSSEADDQPSAKRLPKRFTPLPLLSFTKPGAVDTSFPITRQRSAVSDQRSDQIEAALPQRREGLPKPQADAPASGFYRPGSSNSRNNSPLLTFSAAASSIPPEWVAIRKDRSVAGATIDASGRLSEATDAQSLDSDDRPLVSSRKVRDARTEDLQNASVEQSTDLGGIRNTPSGKPYHCFRAGSREGSAIFPDGYRLDYSNKFAAEYEWICPIRDCRGLFTSLPGLNSHFTESHGNLKLNDNMDGTLSMVGRRDDLSLPGSIVVSQRPTPAILPLVEPWVWRKTIKDHHRHLDNTSEGEDSPSVEESQDEDASPPPTVSDVASDSSEELVLLLDALEDAQESELWNHTKSFLPHTTQAKLTDDVEVSELRALVQLLSYPRKKNLKTGWVTEIRNKHRRRLLTVITLLVRAVSDESSLCYNCSGKDDRNKRCSLLRNIRPEHQALKQLIGGKCCYCVLHEIECQMPLRATNGLSQIGSREDVPLSIRQACRDKLNLILTQTIDISRLSMPSGIPDIAEYAQQRAAPVELRIFESRNDSHDYITRMQTFCDNLRGNGTKDLLLEILDNRVSSSTLDAMTESDFLSRHSLDSDKSSDHRESASRLDPGPSPIDEEANLARSDVPETFGSVMHRALVLGIEVKKLEQQERSRMLHWVTAVFSFPHLEGTQKILKLVDTIHKAPLEMQYELRQDYIASLQVVLPEVPPVERMATILSTPGLSSELERAVFDLVVAMRKLGSEDQDGLGQRVLSTFRACL